MEFINGVSCIKGEIHNIMTLLRLSTRWSIYTRFSGELLIQDENSIIRSFRRLNEKLEGIYDIRMVDCVDYLQSFCHIIISDSASGPLTSAALSSVSKFVLYGFLSSDLPRASEGINLIANCIPKCIFVETDWESDEVILMKLLELSALTLQCDSSSLLTATAAWEIYSTCMSIHNQSKASKLLKSEAETVLRHLTLTSFSRAGTIYTPTSLLLLSSSSSPSPLLTPTSPNQVHSHQIYSNNNNTSNNNNKHGINKNNNLNDNIDNLNDKFSIENGTWDITSNHYNLSGSIGITLLLVKIMKSLCNEIDPNSKSFHIENTKFFLSLINIALEAGGPSLGEMESLVKVLRGDVCRHLLNCSQSDDLGILSLSLRVVFNLFVSIKNHMKVQLEVFLTSVHLRILKQPTSNSSSTTSSSFSSTSNSLSLSSSSSSTTTTTLSSSLLLPSQTLISAREELALESLLEFCREPSLMEDIYTNYDCDVQCTNLFDSIITTLCNRANPSILQNNNHNSHNNHSNNNNPNNPPVFVNILNRLALEGVLVILHAVALKCSSKSKYQLNSKNNSNKNMNGHSSELNKNDNNSNSNSNNNNSNNSIRLLSDVDKWCFEGCDDEDEDDNLNNILQNISNIKLSQTESSDEVDVELIRAKSDVLRQRRLKKQRMRLAAEKFNEKPLSHEWVRFAADLSLLPKIQIGTEATNEGAGAGLCSAKNIALFLKTTPNLGKTQLGEYLSRGPWEKYPFHAEVLKEYLNTFDFGPSTSFVDALRIFLGHFRLPGEAQCIDRLMESFASRIFTFLGPGNPFVSADAAFILAFSTIMLNTDLHNKNMTTKMKLEEFIRNNRGINGGQDLPREYLENLYNEIKNKELMVDTGVTDISGIPHGRPLYPDDASWMKLLRKGLADQAPASFTPTIMARRGVSGDDLILKGIPDFPFSSHERDMFLVMAKQVLDVIFSVWCCSDDDILLSRILSGICDYATICIALELKDQLDSLLQLIACFSIDLVDTSSQLQFDIDSISNLLSINFEQLEKFGPIPQYQKSKVAQEETSNPFLVVECDDILNPWKGLRLARGFVLLQLFFHQYGKCFSYLTQGSHYCFIRLLLWARRNHVLGIELIDLDDFTDSKGGPLIPSKFCMEYKNKIKNEYLNEPIVEQKEESLWTSVATLGGLLWSTSSTSSSSTSSSSSSSQSEKKVKINFSSNHITILEKIFTGKKLNDLLFLNTRNLQDNEFIMIINCLLTEILGPKFTVAKGIISSDCFYSGKHQQKLIDFLFDGNYNTKEKRSILAEEDVKTKRDPTNISEPDAVIVLEWVSRIVFLNRQRADCVWGLVHEYLQFILQSDVQEISKYCPYLIERAVVAVIRAAMHLIQPEEVNNIANLVWKSIIIIHEVPHEILICFAERLGAGLVSLVRGSPGVTAIVTVEYWCLIFGLLSCVSTNDRGRLYVWEILCYLIEENLINNLNFTPCRDLVIQFLTREGYERKQYIEGDIVSGGCLHMMKLTLMALGGYKYYSESQNSMIIGSQAPAHFMKFILPTPDSNYLNQSTNNSLAHSEFEITVVCINFLHIENVVDLWLDTVRILSDLAQFKPLEISKNATFCLKAIIRGGTIVNLPPKLWIEAWSEMLLRLPLSFERVSSSNNNNGNNNNISNGNNDSINRSKRITLERQDILEMCLRSSILVFELLISHFKSMRSMEQFQSLWLRTITNLALNVNQSGSGVFQSESVEMIGSLLRLLDNPTETFDSKLNQQQQQQNNQYQEGSEQKVISDSTLLQISWHAARAGCPTLLSLLRKQHPRIVEVLSNLDTKGSNQVETKSVPEYKSLYSRLFDSKSQIV